MATTWYTTIQVRSWQDLQQEYEERFSLQGIRWIFRGHQNAEWALKSSLERVVCDRFGMRLSSLPVIERNLINHFRRNLHRFQTRLPAEQDQLEWLALMQHHGAPTRLVDWTYSCYIALFFAIEAASPGSTCAVWAIDHAWLFNLLRRRRVKGLRKAFRIDPRLKAPKAVEALLTSGLTSVVPLVPYYVNERLATQQGVFLTPLNLRVSFMDNLRGVASPRLLRQHLLKIEIPVTRRAQYQMLASLDRLNVNRLSLFPGIDGFAQSLQLRPLRWNRLAYR